MLPAEYSVSVFEALEELKSNSWYWIKNANLEVRVKFDKVRQNSKKKSRQLHLKLTRVQFALSAFLSPSASHSSNPG
jgi:hypothetical protein